MLNAEHVGCWPVALRSTPHDEVLFCHRAIHYSSAEVWRGRTNLEHARQRYLDVCTLRLALRSVVSMFASCLVRSGRDERVLQWCYDGGRKNRTFKCILLPHRSYMCVDGHADKDCSWFDVS